MVSAKLRERDPAPPWQPVFVVGWAGMRGVVSLAAALALPREGQGGAPFPHRELVIFVTFFVILVTLVGQGLTLPLVIRALNLDTDDTIQREERTARVAAAEAAVSRIAELEHEWPDHKPLINQLKTMYDHRAEHIGLEEDEERDLDRELVEHKLIREAVITAEREAVIGLRDRGVINDEVLRRVERDLDLEELRMEA